MHKDYKIGKEEGNCLSRDREEALSSSQIIIMERTIIRLISQTDSFRDGLFLLFKGRQGIRDGDERLKNENEYDNEAIHTSRRMRRKNRMIVIQCSLCLIEIFLFINI
jgi:hypothetical protein